MPDIVLKHRYELIEELGHNPFFVTWKAQDRLLNRSVVVKMVRPLSANIGGSLPPPSCSGPEKFIAAMQRVQPLVAPGWARLIEAGNDQGQFFIVREYVAGYLLSQKIRIQAPFSWREAVSILQLLSQMVADLHQQGWVHGHLHPANIFISRQGYLKITDVGQAAALVQAYGTVYAQLANPVYLAPEQRRGRPPQVASDFYGLGVVLYELLTGHPPSPSTLGTPDGSFISLLREKRAEIPRELERITMKMLQSAPTRRYSSAVELREDLKRLQQGVREALNRTEASQITCGLQRNTLTKTSSLPLPQDKTEVSLGVWKVVRSLLRVWVVIVGIGLSTGLCLGLGAYGIYWYWERTIPPEVVVPEVVGQRLEEAQESMRQAGLDFVEMKQFSDEMPPNHILRTVPPGGRRVRKGRSVQAVVSSGKELLNVPNVVGRTISQAREIIQQAGLQIGLEQEVSDDAVPPGYVVSQVPSAGDPIEKGGHVNLVVSKGPITFKSKQEGEESIQEKEIHAGRVKILIPSSPRSQRVKIVVQDSRGERVVYNRMHVGGEEVTQEISGTGNTLVKILFNDQLIQSQTL